MTLPGTERAGREQSFTNPLCSALPPEKLHDLRKKRVFEAAFPLHEVRPRTWEETPGEVEERGRVGETFGQPGLRRDLSG